ncbi:MAG: glycine cleavage system aminomethyltransferase GcvT [Bacteroidetes bacterium]|nr:glycine cleavage system aminomethyltransferase GcvT [Bacteroidota bacterium]
MKLTALHEIHKKLNAKLVPFAGYEMPIQYSGIIEEHKIIRNKVGVFDVSHMGEFFIEGLRAEEFLQQVTINDVAKLSDCKAQYTAMCNPNGGIIDDVLLYRFTKSKYMMVVNASNIEKDFNWLIKNNLFDVDLQNKSDEYSLLAIQGPKSEIVLQKLTETNLSEIQYYSFIEGKISNCPAIISRTGYTGEKGFELYIKNEYACKIWEQLFETGKEFEITPIGLGARDTLRLEMGFCLYGNDIDETTNPIEAGLSWITKLNKEKFFGKDVLIKIKENGLKRKLIGISLNEKNVARHGYNIVDCNSSQIIGSVTSGNFSPSLEKPIALAFVETNIFLNQNPKICVDIRGKLIEANIVKLPFYKGSN